MTTEIPALSTDPRNPPRAPRGLRTRGKAYWVAVSSRYSLRVDELVLLEAMARTLDQLQKIEAALEDEPLTVLGSMKQVTVNPLISEARQLRQSWAAMARQLGLPDEAVPVGGGQKSPRHQRAVQTRWANHRAAVEAAGALAERRAD